MSGAVVVPANVLCPFKKSIFTDHQCSKWRRLWVAMAYWHLLSHLECIPPLPFWECWKWKLDSQYQVCNRHTNSDGKFPYRHSCFSTSSPEITKSLFSGNSLEICNTGRLVRRQSWDGYCDGSWDYELRYLYNRRCGWTLNRSTLSPDSAVASTCRDKIQLQTPQLTLPAHLVINIKMYLNQPPAFVQQRRTHVWEKWIASAQSVNTTHVISTFCNIHIYYVFLQLMLPLPIPLPLQSFIKQPIFRKLLQ